ncbi:MAG: hypothetical protein OXI96_10080 [Acidimicrobiaceae bacterium]|nr:hypothetical protein [Acidimicrobiaceae bacterium]
METFSIRKLEALALIIGPIVALTFFLLEPGSLFIDRVDATDALGKIETLSSNKGISHLVGVLTSLGLVILLYGVVGLKRAFNADSMIDSFAQFGVFCLIIGGFGWFVSSGFVHVIAEIQMDSEQMKNIALGIQKTDNGIAGTSSMFVALGFLVVSLRFSIRSFDGSLKIASVINSIVSTIAFIAFIVGVSYEHDTMIAIGRACYLPWTIWICILGIRSLKQGCTPQTTGVA